ncbi:hypothetical protein NPX13_g4838 [Xylaria arbuscula]|uniref:Uncharacterized protein n=1 Tax=Xylaria arbuscula TaxID=114810 RepID=A0A9W8NFJ1_9PEZI|nr:hypothetical protein NPX13_g4838 [Xylaria arbuscula]
MPHASRGCSYAGTVADEVDDVIQGKRLTSIVHRADFLQELLADIPREQLHASKKLQIVDGKGPVTLCPGSDSAQSMAGWYMPVAGSHQSLPSCKD